MIELHTRVVFWRPAQAPDAVQLAAGERLLELREDAVGDIAQSYRQHGMRGDMARIARRFALGAKFYAIEAEGQGLVAWTWGLVGVPRYLDEFGWLFELESDQAWGRDAFVVPSRRGHRMLLALINAASVVEARPLQLFSDVDPANVASMQAHLAMGMRPVAKIRALAIGRRLLLRQRPVPALPPVGAVQPRRRLLWRTGQSLEWHEAHIA
jgi:hypothetical protein